jgi:hypothetical protein
MIQHQRTRRHYSILLIMLTLINNVSRVSASFISRATFRKTKFKRRNAFRVFLLSNGENTYTDNDASPPTAQGLVGCALRRAMDTMATKDNLSDSKPTVQEIMKELQASLDESAREKERMEQSLLELSDAMLQGAFGRAMRTMSTKTGPNIEDASTPFNSKEETEAVAERRPDWRPAQVPDAYLMNPAITPTALAHHMWSHALRPNIDTAIDATCGNGNDSVAVASMLFNDNDGPTRVSQLLCIDIQQEACDVTRDRLTELLPEDTMTCNVNVLCTSHSPLPRPRDVSSVGLVCYNLGYLPQSDQAVLTQMETTISSIADAALLVRVGGLISVTTYPRSNKNEDFAVHALLEGLALLSSKSVDWRRDYVEELGPDIDTHDGEEDESYSVRDTVRAALERIVHEGGPPKQTWRVMENKMLGRALSPILLTATRIK